MAGAEPRVCSHCKEEKAATEFYRSRNIRSGYTYQCKPCRKESVSRSLAKRVAIVVDEKTCNVCHVRQAASMFYKDSAQRDGLNGRCKTCLDEYLAAWKSERQANGGQRASIRPRSLTKSVGSRYLIASDEYASLLALQNGRCALCHKEETATRNGNPVALSVDHSHRTGETRGLLCSNCNNGLGRFMDDSNLLARAAVYVAHRSA